MEKAHWKHVKLHWYFLVVECSLTLLLVHEYVRWYLFKNYYFSRKKQIQYSPSSWLDYVKHFNSFNDALLVSTERLIIATIALRKKCPYSELSFRIQSECGKIRTRKTSNTATFHAVLFSVDQTIFWFSIWSSLGASLCKFCS